MAYACRVLHLPQQAVQRYTVPGPSDTYSQTPCNLSVKLSPAVGYARQGVLTPEQAVQRYTGPPATCTVPDEGLQSSQMG